MSKSPFRGTVTHVLMPVYILQALNMRTREFASAKTNAIEKYREDLEKMKVNGPGKRKLGQGRNYGTD